MTVFTTIMAQKIICQVANARRIGGANEVLSRLAAYNLYCLLLNHPQIDIDMLSDGVYKGLCYND